MNQVNWTKLDVSIINRKLSKLNVYKHKGVVFYKSNPDSIDPFDIAMGDMLDRIGGAGYVYMAVEAIALITENQTSELAAQVRSMAAPDENGKFMTIVFDGKLFQSKYNHLREFVIAHEMAHVHYHDHNATEEMIDGLLVSLDKEMRADKYAVELLDSKYEALAFFKHTLEMMAAVDLLEFPLEQLADYNTTKKNLQKRQYAVNK